MTEPGLSLSPLPWLVPARGSDARVRDLAVCPPLSVLVVNYRSWLLTARLVRQLRDSAAWKSGLAEAVIVDNGSPGHPIVPRLRRAAGVSLRRWTRNRGFARGVNEGCRLARGAWFLLLNPDVSVEPGFLDRVLELIARLERESPRVGIVGLGLRDPDGQPQGSTGPAPTLVRTLWRTLWPRAWRKYHLPVESAATVDWVTGCGLLLRRRCWQELGGLDRRYFLYYEDVDLCRRAWAAGWQVLHEPALRCVHHAPLHRREKSAYLRLLTRHALLTYARSHWPGWQARLAAALVRGEACLRGLAAWWRGDAQARVLYRRLEKIASDLQRDDEHSARRRLHCVVARREGRT